jgi:hypothetical protein
LATSGWPFLWLLTGKIATGEGTKLSFANGLLLKMKLKGMLIVINKHQEK